VSGAVLVIAATLGEAQLLQERLANAAEVAGGVSVASVVITGMGAVNAAHALTRELVLSPHPRLVLQVGIGGAFVQANLPVGGVAIATEEVYGDVGVITPDGWLSAEGIGIPLVAANEQRTALFNHFRLDTALAERAAAICGARTGRFLTLARVTGVRALADTLYERFGAICESMEGAAAAQICSMYDVPFLELRGISNLVEDRDRSKWRIREAALAAQEAALKVIEHL